MKQLLPLLACALPITSYAANPIIIDGSDHRLLIDSRGRVCALEIDSAEFALWDSFSESSTDVRRSTNRLFEHFGDDFDFILFVDNVSEGGGSGRHFSVSNSVTGIGKSTFDVTSLYGSAGKLKSAIHLTNPNTLRGGPSLHEIAHRWGNSLDLVPNGGGHWGYSSVGGQLGGWRPGTFVDLSGGQYDADGFNGSSSFGTFANGGNSLPYSELELYTMGLIPAGDVANLLVAQNAAWVDQANGIFSASSVDTVTINNIITQEGARSPDHTASQKSFRTLVVLLTDGSVSDDIWNQMDTDAAAFSLAGDNGSSIYNFYEATGGRATMQLDGLLDSLSAGNEALTVTSPISLLAEKFGNNPPSITQTTTNLSNDTTASIPWQSTSPAWVTVTPTSGTLAPGANIDVTLALNATANSLPRGNYTGEVTFTNTDNNVYSEEPVGLLFADLIFEDDFETGSFLPDWVISGTGTYRVRVLDSFDPVGNFKALLDDSVSDTDNFAAAQMTLTLDLKNWSNVVLRFDAKEYFDEPHSPPAAPFDSTAGFDGVSIRVSKDADEWYEVQSLRSLSSTYETITVDIDGALNENGLSYTDQVQIRFNQYDNFALNTDGIAIDNILISGTPPAFLTWASNFGLTGDELLPGSDTDKDGQTLLEEFGFDGDPTSGADDAKSRTSFTTITDDDYFTLTIPVRDGASFTGTGSLSATIDGITYEIRGSSDLQTWTAEIAEVSPALDSELPTLSPDWGYRTFRYPISSEDAIKAFIQALVTEAP